MTDPIIKATADRLVRNLRKAFHKQSPTPVDGDEILLHGVHQAVVRGLSLAKARREKKRKKHERTVDMFSDRDSGE